jgi:hypothetical protein
MRPLRLRVGLDGSSWAMGNGNVLCAASILTVLLSGVFGVLGGPAMAALVAGAQLLRALEGSVGSIERSMNANDTAR